MRYVPLRQSGIQKNDQHMSKDCDYRSFGPCHALGIIPADPLSDHQNIPNPSSAAIMLLK